MFLFGKYEKTPKEKVREWTSKLKGETRSLDRQIRAIQREEEKVKKSLKDAAKKGDADICKVLAKEVIKARRSITRIHTSKAQINSVQMSMNHQLSILKVSGCLEKSTEVMEKMQNLVKMTEVSQTMQELAKEMMKAGIIEEMMEDTFQLFEDEELVEEADQEIDKILWEVTAGQLGTAPVTVSDVFPETEVEGVSAPTDKTEDGIEERLGKLRS